MSSFLWKFFLGTGAKNCHPERAIPHRLPRLSLGWEAVDLSFIIQIPVWGVSFASCLIPPDNVL